MAKFPTQYNSLFIKDDEKSVIKLYPTLVKPKANICDKGREIYLTFQWGTVQVGSGESAQNVNEKDILQRVVGKFKAHLEAKKNPIMAAVKFDRRRQTQGEKNV